MITYDIRKRLTSAKEIAQGVTLRSAVHERDEPLLLNENSNRTPLLMSMVSTRLVVRAGVNKRALQTMHQESCHGT